MERRGFLRGLLSAGPLALLVQPGLSATPDLVAQRAIWTPETPVTVPSTGALMIQVSRYGLGYAAMPLVSLVISDRGSFQWVARPGGEIWDAKGHQLLEVSVAARVKTHDDAHITTLALSGGQLTWYHHPLDYCEVE